MTRQWEVFKKYGKFPRGMPLLNKRKTHCKRGHPLSGDNVYVRANGNRRCRTCKRLQQRAAANDEEGD